MGNNYGMSVRIALGCPTTKITSSKDKDKEAVRMYKTPSVSFCRAITI